MVALAWLGVAMPWRAGAPSDLPQFAARQTSVELKLETSLHPDWMSGGAQVPGIASVAPNIGSPAGQAAVRALAELHKRSGLANQIADMRVASVLHESDLADKRGGFDGISFSALFEGRFDRNGSPIGELVVEATTVSATANTSFALANASGPDVQMQTVVGDFAGARGIFQITQVPGDLNIVTNNMYLQVYVVESAAKIPSLSSLITPFQ